MLAIFPPAGIAMLILYLYSDAKESFFSKKKLEEEKGSYSQDNMEKWV